jgi:hypothetical protein
MKKLAAPLTLTLCLALAACGKGDGEPAAQTGGGNAIATAPVYGGPCPELHGRYVRYNPRGFVTGEFHARTWKQNGLFAYAFDDNARNPEFRQADGIWRAYGPVESGNMIRVTCDAGSVTSVTQKPGRLPVTTRYVRLDAERIKVETDGRDQALSGVYRHVKRRR